MALNIVISGSTGMVGCALMDHFAGQGHRMARLLRDDSMPLKSQESHIYWNIQAQKIEQQKLCGQDVVIHLAGAPISRRWTAEHKRLIETSRVEGTRFLSNVLANLKQKPRLLISASAIGYYGSYDLDVSADEESAPAEGFLSGVCRRWEEETRFAAQAAIRVVNLRLGVVLAKQGGVLAKMLPVFRCGLGGVLGSGNQIISWVALKEIPWIVEHIIQTESLTGPLNAVAPLAVTNRHFVRTLGQVLKRSVFLPVPAYAISVLWGEMGRELLLKGARVIPQKLQSSGYDFKYPDVQSALVQAMS